MIASLVATCAGAVMPRGAGGEGIEGVPVVSVAKVGRGRSVRGGDLSTLKVSLSYVCTFNPFYIPYVLN